ncbi:MAG: metallophosphoesterase [Clostridia bacterium]|nr:metallophosphoesterase [Clostridia bacterium]
MGFLKFNPAVYVIGEEYEVAVAVESFGLVTVRVGDEIFYEDNSGVLPTEKLYARIRIPQAVLDGAGGYTVVFRRTIERKSYWSTLGEEETAVYSFKAPRHGKELNLYHISDVHYCFESAKKVASYFGDDTDLYIFNGDIGEVQTDEDYLAVCRLVGEIAGGNIPVLFVRGNHDTRGRLPEKYTDYFPANGKQTYFTAKFGDLKLLCLDLGEDKRDDCIEYGGFNNFHGFRLKETEFLRALLSKGEEFDMAICHIPSSINNSKCPGDKFDIDGEIFEEWNSIIAKLNVKVMLSGHKHKAYVLNKNDKRSIRPHDFPIIVGSVADDDYLMGAALTLSKETLTVKFTDKEHNVAEEYEIHLPTGSVNKK